MSWRCFLLWHRWRAQAAQRVDFYRGVNPKEGEIPTRSVTHVLYRCARCPKHKVEALRGRWTLEQLVLGEEMHDSPRPKVSA